MAVPPRLIITRPRQQAQPWVAALRAEGHEVHALPLIDIQPVADTAPLEAAWRQLDRHAALMFVSANAVHCFFAVRPPDAPWPKGVIAACTGPGTAAALRAAGVPAQALVTPDDGQPQESESLWARLSTRNWRGARVRVVRGEVGRDWLADQWRSAGADVSFLTAYRRAAPGVDEAGRELLAQAVSDPGRWLWHFSSGEAVGHLQTLAPEARWSEGWALATHSRIARAARDAGFGRVKEVLPGLDALRTALSAQGSIEGPHLQSKR